jgi:hypothetical protein
MRCLGSPVGLFLSRLVGNSLGFGVEEWVVGFGVESGDFTWWLLSRCCKKGKVIQ